MASRFGGELGLAMAGELHKPIRAVALKTLLAGLRGSVDVIAAETVADPVTPETLAKAIAAGRLFLMYQPQVTIPGRRIVGVEALVRWRTASGRVIGPDNFIPLAERSGLIDNLTAWVIDAAVQQAGRWRAEGRDFKVSVNLSARNIHDRHLPDLLAARCRREGVPPEGLVLELTETATMQDAAMLMEVLGRFRLKGFPLSIDDFGTGYSSIAQLLRLPFSELKVDKSFVMSMDRTRESAVVTRTIIDMAHHLGLPVIAEGVETEEAFTLLSEFGCDFAQGYLVSRPVGAEVIAGFPAVLQCAERMVSKPAPA
ncbi:diguanylate cyclase [uncultured Gammaproteobacteria bacterium]